ncbi:efflux RND transporter permease subunit [Chloroherpeton thalassium]|nr:efflux RND transporter permease subunit [Chloroherpeton thalassium]
MTITEISIKRPTLVVVIFSVLGVLGLFSYNQLKYELLPKITPPYVSIAIVYPGASPTEVETSITKPVEEAVSGIDKIETISSTAAEGISTTVIEFDQEKDVDLALQDVQRRVNEILETFPEDAKSPVISKFALDEVPVLRIGATAEMPNTQFYQFLKDEVKPELAKVDGVGQVILVGGDEREIRVNLDADKLRAYNLSLLEVTEMLKASNMDFPTGKIDDNDGQYIVRIAGKLSSIEALRNLVISRDEKGNEIKLRNIAEVQDGQKETTALSRVNGREAVGVLIQKQSGANGVEVSRNVRQSLSKLESLNSEMKLNFDIAQDASLFTIDAADAVKSDLAIAVVMVALVMLLFLHSIRNSLIVMVAIPASLISTFIAMYALGYTLNLMTLLALSLVVGILVDDSIVVLENIYRHLEMGEDRRTAALRGRNEIGFTALSITMVDVVVFFPLSLATGLVGNIMREFAIVMVVSTLLSLFVSFTITPTLASRFSKIERLTKKTLLGKIALAFEAGYDKFSDNYISLLKWGLGNRWKVGVITTLLFISSVLLLGGGFVGAEFMSSADRGEFAVTIQTDPGATLEQTNYISQHVEQVISAIPEVKKLFVNVGTSSEGIIGQSSNNITQITVTLVPKDERARSTEIISNEIRRKVQEIPGIKVWINPIGIFGTADDTPIMLVVNGANRSEVQHAAMALADSLKVISGTVDVRLSSEEGKPETRVEIDREKMAALGLTLAEVGSTLRVAFTGDDEAKFRDGADEYDIRVMLDEFDRSKIQNVKNITIKNRDGKLIELGQFADVYQTTGPTKLQRKDRNSSVVVMSQLVGRPLGSVGADIKKTVAASYASGVFPKSITITYDGDMKQQAESSNTLGLAFMAGILFVYLIMVALYDSYTWPFVVLFSIPLAIIGALFALALSAKTLTIFSILGVIMLVGLVGKNAILLVDFTNKLREEGMNTHDALLEAGRERLRPILMTTLTMVVGMMPIALSHSSGSEWKSGLAWALIGGLSSSMFLTLVLIPVVYTWFDNLTIMVGNFASKFQKSDSFEQANLKGDSTQTGNAISD